MSSANKTGLGLNQWTMADIPEMEDYNRDNQILDSQIVQAQQGASSANQKISEVNGYFMNGKAKEALHSDTAKLADNLNYTTLTVPTSLWQDSTEFISFPYEAFVSGPVEDYHDLIIFFDPESVLVAMEAGMMDGIAKTVQGGIRLFAEKIPTQNLNGTYCLLVREG